MNAKEISLLAALCMALVFIWYGYLVSSGNLKVLFAGLNGGISGLLSYFFIKFYRA